MVVKHMIIHFERLNSIFHFVAKLLIYIDHPEDQLHLYHNRLLHITMHHESLTVELRPSGKSFIYSNNSNGPKTVPWGTPDVATTGVDDAPSITTDWVRYGTIRTN